MGWRSTGAAFKAGTYKGPLTSGDGGFASGFAQTFSAGVNDAVDYFLESKKDEQKFEREKELITLRETLERQRTGADNSTSAGRKQMEQLQEAQAFASQHGIPLEEAISRLMATDYDSSQAGDRLTEERATGVTVDTNNSFIPDSPPPSSMGTTETDPTLDLSFGEPPEDNLEATEPAPQIPVASASEPVERGPVRLASRGDTMTDVPVQYVSAADIDVDTPVDARAAAVVEEVGQKAADLGGLASPDVPLSYQERIAAGDTPSEAAAVGVHAATMIPEVFKLPELNSITTLDQAKAALTILDSRRKAAGGRDNYDQNMRPALESMIASFTTLPDLGEMAQENKRDALREYVTNGYKAYEGVVNADDLAAHVARAKELLASGVSMPEIPANLDDLRSMDARVKAGEFGEVPQEWQAQLNVSLRDAAYRDRYGDRLTVDYIFDDARTVRELTGLLESATTALGEDSPVVSDLKTAISMRNDMPDMPKFKDVTEKNYRSLAAEAEHLGNPSLAAEITLLGQSLEDGDPTSIQSRTDAIDASLSALARINTRIGDVQETQANFINAADSAYKMVSILAEEPDVLTFFGGQLPSFMSSIDNEVTAFTEVMSEVGQRDGTIAQAEARVSAFERQIADQLAGDRIDARAAAYARYQAQEIRLAYMLVRSQQPTGPISNTDFQSAVQQVRTSSRGSTVEDSLRQTIGLGRIDVISSQDALANDPQVIGATRILWDAGITDFDPTGGVLRPIQEIADVRGAGDALRWLSGETNLVPRGPAEVPAAQTPTYPKPNQKAIDLLKTDPSMQGKFEEVFGPGSAAQYLGGK